MSDNQNKISNLPSIEDIPLFIKELIVQNKLPRRIAKMTEKNRHALLSCVILNNSGFCLNILLRNYHPLYPVRVIEETLVKSVEIDNLTFVRIIKDLNVSALDFSKSIQAALRFDNSRILHYLLQRYPELFTPKFLGQTLGLFLLHNKHEGVRKILKLPVSEEDINFYCKMAAKDDQPAIVKNFLLLAGSKLTPSTLGLVLIHLVRYSQEEIVNVLLTLHKNIEFDYIERALVKAVRLGNLSLVKTLLQMRINWTYEELERAIDNALSYKQDKALFLIISQFQTLIPALDAQNLVLNAYVNSCYQAVNSLLSSSTHLINAKTKGELLLLATKKDDMELMTLLFNHKIAPPYKLRAYQLALTSNNNELIKFFTDKCPGIEGTYTKYMANMRPDFETETSALLTFQFSRLRIKAEAPLEKSKDTFISTQKRKKH
jgi:hypothetical protein